MGVRKRIHPTGYGLDFSLRSRINAFQNIFHGIKNIKKIEFWRNHSVPPELRSDLLFAT